MLVRSKRTRVMLTLMTLTCGDKGHYSCSVTGTVNGQIVNNVNGKDVEIKGRVTQNG